MYRKLSNKIKRLFTAPELDRARKWAGFISFNLSILLGACLLMPYRKLVSGALEKYVFCFLNRFFHLYCPTCGITRALDSILHLRFADAARENICVLVLVIMTAYFDLRAFIALLRREERIVKVKLVHVWLFIAALIVFGILRNVLLIRFGIDPLGDNIAYWSER